MLLKTVDIVNLDQCTPFEAPDLAIIREWISPRNSGAKTISLAEITIPPGVQVKPHYHIVLEEHYFILEGSGIMELCEESREVSPGDAIVILPKQRHTITNNTDNPLKMYVTCVPAWTEEDQVFCD